MNQIKIPKNQILWLTYCDQEHNPQYVVTSDQQRNRYTLYKVLKDYMLEKLKTSIRPMFREVGYYE